MKTLSGKLDAGGLRIAILVSRYHELVTTRLVAGARSALSKHGAVEDQLVEVSVPGAWELPLASKALAESGRYDAIVCLGCVIRGDTTHHEHVGGQAAAGLAKVALECGVPIGLGLLTTDNLEQAIERAGGKAGDKGAEAAMAAVEMANLIRDVKGHAR